MSDAPRVKVRSSPAVSSWKARPPSSENRKALRPNAAMGNAVAVPRCVGQLMVAVLMVPKNADAEPMPVMPQERHRSTKWAEPRPLT